MAQLDLDEEGSVAQAPSQGSMDPGMKAYIMQKYGIGTPVVNQGAFEAANDNTLAANLGRAGSLIGASIAGTKVDEQGWNNILKSANSPIDQAKIQSDADLVRAKLLAQMTEKQKLKNVEGYSKSGEKAIYNPQTGKMEVISGLYGEAPKPESASYTHVQDDKGNIILVDTKTGKVKPTDIKGKTDSTVGLPYADRVAKLSTTDKGRFDNVVEGIKALRTLDLAATSGQKPGLGTALGFENDYTVARKEYTDAIARMQSGGALTDDEARFYTDQAPTAQDFAANPKLAAKKIAGLTDKMNNRLNTLGFLPDEVPSLVSYKPTLVTPTDKKSGTATAGPAKKPGHVRMVKGASSFDIKEDNKRAIEAAKAEGYTQE
jgi:hypothetical protein